MVEARVCVSTEHCEEGSICSRLFVEVHRSRALDHRIKPVPPDLRGGWRDGWVAADVLEFTSHGYGGHMFDAAGKQVDFPADRFRADCVADQLLHWLEHGRDPNRPFAAMIRAR